MAWIPPNSCFRGLVEKGGRGECCRGSVLPASVPRAVGGVQLMLGFQGGALPWCGVVKMLVKPGPGSRMASSSIVIGGCRTGTQIWPSHTSASQDDPDLGCSIHFKLYRARIC